LNREEKRVLVLTAPSHFLVHLLEGVLPPLIPLLITVFHTDYFHLGLVVTIFSYAFGLGSLPSGYLSDRIGPKRIVTIFLFGAGLLSIFILPVRSLLAYSVIMGCIGLFCSTYHPASNTLISHVFKEKGNAFAINGITGSLGTAAAPLLSAWLGWAFGWKSPHILFGLACIGVGIYALTLMKQPMGKTKIEHAKTEKEKQSDTNPYIPSRRIIQLERNRLVRPPEADKPVGAKRPQARKSCGLEINSDLWGNPIEIGYSVIIFFPAFASRITTTCSSPTLFLGACVQQFPSKTTPG